jgi:dihydropteroate synthase
MEPLLWRADPYVLDCAARTHVMAVLNVTPDSFSDGGRFFDEDRAVAAGVDMAAWGADVIDVGGESTRPGATSAPVEEEVTRVVPVIKRLAAQVDVPISVDTRKPEVAAEAMDAGAVIVNDVTAGATSGMFDVVRASGAGMVLMHMRGDPATMSGLTGYDDVVDEVRRFLQGRLDAAVAAGIDVEHLALDPGLGFAKTWEQSLLLMRDVSAFLPLGRPLVVGASRKSFIGRVTGAPPNERREGTAAAVAWLAAHGAHVVRVHDVRQMVSVVRMIDAIRRARAGSP